MNREVVGRIVLVSILVFGLSCNWIAGIGGDVGVECSKAGDCPDLGECVVASCNDGLCQHAPSAVGTRCSVGVCGEGARCVECVDDDHCVADPLPLRCSKESRCVECITDIDCKDPVRRQCSQGNCVECVLAAECKPPMSPCLEQKCAGGSCLFVVKPLGEMCDGGTCGAEGECMPLP